MPQLSAQGPVAVQFPTSEIRTSSVSGGDISSSVPPKGQRARDVSGNEYVLVKFSAINYYGGWCVIDNNFNAGRITTALVRGAVGICMRTVAVDDYGWVQIYGIHPAAQVTTSASDSGVAVGTPTVLLPKTTTEPSLTNQLYADTDAMANPVIGAYQLAQADSNATIASGAVVSDAVSSAYSGTFARVMLNFPYLSGITYPGNAS